MCAAGRPLLLGWHALQAAGERELREDDPALAPVHPELLQAQARRCAAWATRCASSSRTRRATSSTRTTCEALQKVNDAVYLIPGVDRSFMRGAVDQQPALDRGHRRGLSRRPGHAGRLRRLARRRWTSSRPTSRAPASSAATWPTTCKSTHDRRAAAGLATRRRASRSTTRLLARPGAQGARARRPTRCKIHIVGFAKIVGDLIDGLHQVMVVLRPVGADRRRCSSSPSPADLRSTLLLVRRSRSASCGCWA